MAERRNVLMESVRADPDLGETKWTDLVERAKVNPFYRRLLREGLYSDMSYALGAIHDIVIEAAKRMAVANNIVWTIPVTQPLIRFYLAKRGKAWRVGEGPGLRTGERFEKKDIELKYEWEYSAEWSQSYLEDVPFSILERQVADIGQTLEEQLTSDIMALYEGVAAANLAGGAEISAASAGTLAWTDLVKAWTAVKKEGFRADAAIVHPDQIADLWADDRFIHSFYFGEKVDVERGLLGNVYLGFRIVETDLATVAKCHLVDTRYAAALTLRRDIITEPYEDPRARVYGVVGSRRYGLDTLRTKAIARITGC